MVGTATARRSSSEDREQHPAPRSLGRSGQQGSAAHASAPVISGLAECVEDARLAALDGDSGPAEPTDFHPLRGRLETARSKFPPLYRQEFVEPFVAGLEQLGPASFTEALIRD